MNDGQVLQQISAACALFLQHHGSIQCEVTGDGKPSSDILQGRHEVPCDLIYRNDDENDGLMCC